MERKKKVASVKKTQRKHLFNPHTDTCLFCGADAEDTLMDPSPCEVATNRNIERAPLYEDN
jgi:hypothetical protein